MSAPADRATDVRRTLARRLAWALATILAAGAMAGSLAAEAGDASWVFEAIGAFRVQYAFAIAALLVVFAWGERPLRAALCGVWSLALLVMSGGPWFREPAPPGARTARAVVLNVMAENRRHSDVLDYVRSADPDIVALLEVNDRWIEALRPLEASLPHVVAVPRTDRFGIAVYSRLPLRNVRVAEYPEAFVPTIDADVDVGGTPLHVIATHPVPPVSDRALGLRNRQFEALAKDAAGAGSPVLLIGDLNAAPWSPAFRRLVAESGLRDSRDGFGIHPTWPSMAWWLGVPLDHVLASPTISVRRREVGPDVGSDHFGVMVEFSMAR